MTVYNLGSINIDHFYQVPYLPAEGETIAAESYRSGLGGKGANQSVAAARAGSRVVHIGAIGAGGRWTVERLRGFGVDVTHVAELDGATGHAIIMVGATGENMIVIHPGANRAQAADHIRAALAQAGPQDTLVLQNETSAQVEAAEIATQKGMRVIYSAAPFDLAAVQVVLSHVSLLVLNAVEAAQLKAALGQIEGPDMLVTKGAEGAEWHSDSGETVTHPAFEVDAVDTTGAGDCFTGSVIAALDQGLPRDAALRYASAAAALQVTRPGTSEAMPTHDEVQAFLAVR